MNIKSEIERIQLASNIYSRLGHPALVLRPSTHLPLTLCPDPSHPGVEHLDCLRLLCPVPEAA